MSRFMLLLGPSGVGKSAVIDELSKLDDRFVYICPYMTRPLREGERNKVSVSRSQMDAMSQRGELLVVNELFGGILYGTPRLPIEAALSAEKFPVLDWPIDRLSIMKQAFPGQLFSIYVSPPSLDVLRQRLGKDGRDADGARFASAQKELERFWALGYVGDYDYEIVSQEGQISRIAQAIFTNYIQSF